MKAVIDVTKSTAENEKSDLALSETEKNLNVIFDDLREIREVCESENYKNIVSATAKSSLDTQRTYINTALSNIITSKQTISSVKLNNKYNIDVAQAAVSDAEAALKTAQDKLAVTLVKPRQNDIELYEAQISQAQAQVKLIENQIQDSILRSPIDGKIIEIKKKVGEIVQPLLQDVVFVLLPDNPFEIKVDIYEEDIVKVKIGNPVDISLVAFPDKIFKGRVIEINPAEKLIEGIVYYETTINFDEIPEGIKPGMTADLIIKTDSKENVLTIPKDAIQKKNGKDNCRSF
jgi:HlyD family secretion protein